MKKAWRRDKMAIKYGHPYHDGYQGPPQAIGYNQQMGGMPMLQGGGH